VSESGGVEPDIGVFNPAGTLVGSWGYNDGISTLLLTNTANYTVIVHDRGTAAGAYNLGLAYATPKCAAAAINCGQPLTDTITAPAQQNMYSLPGYAGEVIHIRSVPVSGAVQPDVDVFTPAGTWVGSFGYNDYTTQLVLTNTGTFTVIVRDRGNANIGTYTLTLQVMGGCIRLDVGATVVRTQQVACLPLQLVSGSPAVWTSFTIQAPTNFLGNATLTASAQFTNVTFVPGTNAQWLVTLQTAPTNGVLGDQIIGSLCFRASSALSGFAPVTLNNLMVTNQGGLVPGASTSGGRVVVIADQPLLEAGLGANRQRLLTVYGKANTNYEIDYATNLAGASHWLRGWTNNVPASLSYSSAIQGPLSNAPVLFLRAVQR
jgi:hypothetical protein